MTNWTPLEIQHLYPVFLQVALTLTVLVVLFMRRMIGTLQGKIRFSYFKLLQLPPGMEQPKGEQATARNFVNLFELPVLFYTVIILLLVFHQADETSLTLGWVFVASRAAHSLIQITINHVITRFTAYFVGFLTVLVLWARFYIQVSGL